MLRAAAGAQVRAVGQLRIATSTNPLRRGGEGDLSAESLGEPVLDAADHTRSRGTAR
ncbi:MAG: hypothetical protein M3401_07375 [Actinomycetota bacterium]|nr:hypothetical protein [Actinomycetota bacterium]